MRIILSILFVSFGVTSAIAENSSEPSLESLGIQEDVPQPAEPMEEELVEEERPAPTTQNREKSVKKASKPVGKATKRKSIKYEIKTVVNVILSKANIKYALKKKNWGSLLAMKTGGLLVKKINSESLVENFGLKVNDLILKCNDSDLFGGKSLGIVVKAARQQSKFTLTVRRGKKVLLYKYQQ